MRKFILLLLVIALFLLPACGLSNQERDYINDYAYYQDSTLKAVNSLVSLMATWEPDNKAWRDSVYWQLALIRVDCSRTKNMDVPTSMVHIHVKYLRAMDALDSVREPIMTGIVYEYETVPGQVIINLDIGMQHLAETQALIDNF